MANKNLIRRMRQLLILVLILAMTMSFATMTAMADNNISAAIKVGKDFEKGEEVTLIFHIGEDNDVRILATSKGAYLKFDMPTEFFSSNGIKTGDQISFETSFNRSGVITVGEHEGNDGGSENEGSIDNGRNNYEGTVAFNTTSLKLEATKTLDGKAPEKDEVFSFTLKKDGKVVETVGNNGSNISFKELTFKEAGTYTYTISEVKGDDTDITYDETVYTVEVEVTKEGNALVATPTYKKAGEVVREAVFANTTKESGNGGNGNGGTVTPLPPDQNLEDPDTPNTPAEPVEPSEKPLPDDKHTVTEVPKTGDAVANALLFNLLLLSISALAGTVFYLRRKMTDR